MTLYWGYRENKACNQKFPTFQFGRQGRGCCAILQTT